MAFTLDDIQKDIQHQMDRDWADKSERDKLDICFSGLGEETGEVLGLRKRQLRNLPKDRVRSTKDHFIEELGDVLWYLVAVCNMLEISMSELWMYNCLKLEERYGE